MRLRVWGSAGRLTKAKLEHCEGLIAWFDVWEREVGEGS